KGGPAPFPPLAKGGPGGVALGADSPLNALHPLIIFREEPGQVFFLNARHGKRDAEYICYATAERLRQDLGSDPRKPLAAALGMSVAEIQERFPKPQSVVGALL